MLISQMTLFEDLFVALDVIADGKVGPAFESDTALGILAHFGNVLLDVLQRGHSAWISMLAIALGSSVYGGCSYHHRRSDCRGSLGPSWLC